MKQKAIRFIFPFFFVCFCFLGLQHVKAEEGNVFSCYYKSGNRVISYIVPQKGYNNPNTGLPNSNGYIVDSATPLERYDSHDWTINQSDAFPPPYGVWWTKQCPEKVIQCTSVNGVPSYKLCFKSTDKDCQSYCGNDTSFVKDDSLANQSWKNCDYNIMQNPGPVTNKFTLSLNYAGDITGVKKNGSTYNYQNLTGNTTGLTGCPFKIDVDEVTKTVVVYLVDPGLNPDVPPDVAGNALIDAYNKMKAEMDSLADQVRACMASSCPDLEQLRSDLKNKIIEIKKMCVTIEGKIPDQTITTEQLNQLKLLCKQFEAEYQDLISSGVIRDMQSGCGLLNQAMKDKINFFLNLIMILGPVLAIVLGMLDFLRAVVSQEADSNKKAFKRFLYRLIAAALLFLAPLIVEFIINTITPGISEANPFCEAFK